MKEREYQQKIAEAEALRSRRHDYVEGYVRGLLRRHNPELGSLQDNEKWLRRAYDNKGSDAERGRGYMDGLQGVRPRV